MDNNFHHFVNGVFFQTLEYVVAPLVLVLITYFVGNNNERKENPLGEKTTEYTFVSLYSNLLFYFSLSAHHSHATVCCCSQVENALLINAIFLSFLVIIRKNYRNEIDIPALLQYIFNWLWLVAMVVILVLIVKINMHLTGLEWGAKYFSRSCGGWFEYFLAPDHVLLLFFIIVVVTITIVAWRSEYQQSINNYQSIDFTASNSNSVNQLTAEKVVHSNEATPIMRMKAAVFLAQCEYDKSRFNIALNWIESARKYIQMLPEVSELVLYEFREAFIKINFKVGRTKEIEAEINSLQKRFESESETQKKQQIKYYLDKVIDVYNSLKSA